MKEDKVERRKEKKKQEEKRMVKEEGQSDRQAEVQNDS